MLLISVRNKEDQTVQEAGSKNPEITAYISLILTITFVSVYDGQNIIQCKTIEQN